MLHPLRIPRKRHPTDRTAKLVPTQLSWPNVAYQIGSRPQPVARRALYLHRGLVAETRQFVGHQYFTVSNHEPSLTVRAMA
jgi:hypothetical protein